MNKLSIPYKIRLTQDQDKAISILEKYGFNRSKLIRNAIDEYLYAHFRKELAKAKRKLEPPKVKKTKLYNMLSPMVVCSDDMFEI